MYKRDITKGSTIKIFDEFLHQNDPLLLDNSITIRINDSNYWINPIIEKKYYSCTTKIIRNPITITELKKCFKGVFSDILDGKSIDNTEDSSLPNLSLPTYKFLLHFKKSIEQNLLKSNIKEKEIIQLEVPITIHAQTSMDMDYEWEGNQYGDTTTFYITSYQIYLISHPYK